MAKAGATRWVYLVEVTKEAQLTFAEKMRATRNIELTALRGRQFELRGEAKKLREATFYPMMVGHIQILQCDPL
jgi:hypothetical protein